MMWYNDPSAAICQFNQALSIGVETGSISGFHPFVEHQEFSTPMEQGHASDSKFQWNWPISDPQ
eukprot:CCRYP_020898-RB/>CCRYP_020898-RB protein AED:0.49 eAED:1.00 QI:0/0/0/1/0/0/2/0/63